MLSKQSSISLVSKVSILKIPPQAWDALIPHGHKVSQKLVEYLAAGVVRDIAQQVKDESVKKKLMGIGKELARSASAGLVQGWEEGDDICPPWPPFPPFPGPWIWLEDILKPQPDPWTVRSFDQLVLADLTMGVAGVTTDASISAKLKDTAVALARSASKQIVEDFEKTQIKPRSASTK